MAKYNTSDLKTRGTIEQVNREITNELNETDEHWDSLEDRWMMVKPIRAMEKIRNAENVEDISHLIVMRWHNDYAFNALDFRINLDGVIIDLISVIDVDNRHEWFEILGNQKVESND